jgi:adenine-specific DNA-methyltransferase
METSGVKYIGSKFSLLDYIVDMVDKHVRVPPGRRPSVIDVFTGTTRVAQAFRQMGWDTQTSDLSWAAECYALTFLQTNDNSHLQPALDYLNKLRGKTGWITKNYCDVKSEDGTVVRVWQPHNGKKADAIRDEIERAGPRMKPQEKATLIASLIFALDKVDNTVGIQQAYLKQWCPRSFNNLKLVLPQVVSLKSPLPQNKHQVGDCLLLKYEQADLAYLDPPYSSHNYSSYYHIWDSITRWDKPEVGLKTNRRVDRITSSDEYDESMSSPWNSKVRALEAFEQLVKRLPVRYILISYNDESLVPINDLIAAMKKFGQLHVNEIDYKRNIMSQIGNGVVGNTHNKEYLILITRPKSKSN